MAMKYACCAAKAKVMWLTWMLVMLCRLLLLLLLLGLRLSLKKKINKNSQTKLFTFFVVKKVKTNFYKVNSVQEACTKCIVVHVLKGVFSKPSGKYIVSPNLCFLS